MIFRCTNYVYSMIATSQMQHQPCEDVAVVWIFGILSFETSIILLGLPGWDQGSYISWWLGSLIKVSSSTFLHILSLLQVREPSFAILKYLRWNEHRLLKVIAIGYFSKCVYRNQRFESLNHRGHRSHLEIISHSTISNTLIPPPPPPPPPGTYLNIKGNKNQTMSHVAIRKSCWPKEFKLGESAMIRFYLMGLYKYNFYLMYQLRWRCLVRQQTGDN